MASEGRIDPTVAEKSHDKETSLFPEFKSGGEMALQVQAPEAQGQACGAEFHPADPCGREDSTDPANHSLHPVGPRIKCMVTELGGRLLSTS